MSHDKAIESGRMEKFESIAHRLAKRDLSMQKYCTGGLSKKLLEPIIHDAKEALAEYQDLDKP